MHMKQKLPGIIRTKYLLIARWQENEFSSNLAQIDNVFVIIVTFSVVLNQLLVCLFDESFVD